MTRRELVLDLLHANPEGVTTSRFLREGCGSRFGARIQELRNQGYSITCERVREGEFRYQLENFDGRDRQVKGAGNHHGSAGATSINREGSSPVDGGCTTGLPSETFSGQLFELAEKPRSYADPEEWAA